MWVDGCQQTHLVSVHEVEHVLSHPRSFLGDCRHVHSFTVSASVKFLGGSLDDGFDLLLVKEPVFVRVVQLEKRLGVERVWIEALRGPLCRCDGCGWVRGWCGVVVIEAACDSGGERVDGCVRLEVW
jgi:hypothetical protein